MSCLLSCFSLRLAAKIWLKQQSCFYTFKRTWLLRFLIINLYNPHTSRNGENPVFNTWFSPYFKWVFPPRLWVGFVFYAGLKQKSPASRRGILKFKPKPVLLQVREIKTGF
jgi:hypothetical protein